MKIDLHVHTHPASACSNMTADDMIKHAKNVGLEAVCLTEHNRTWEPDEIARLREKHDFCILRAMEVTTRDGDVLAFGVYDDINETLTAAELHRRVHELGGYAIAAHPFRGFLLFSFVDIALTPQRAAMRPIFQSVDAIEAYNCKVTERETRLAVETGAHLSLPCTAGSDAHTLADVGKYHTVFENQITTEEELVRELRAGRFRPQGNQT